MNAEGEQARSGEGDPSARAEERRVAAWLFVSTLCVLLLIHNGGLSGLDGETFYQVAKSAVDHHRLDVGPGFNTTTGVGGHEYAKSNLGLPLLAAVFYALSAPVDWLAPGHSDLIRTALVGASMPLIIAAIVVAVFRLARTLGARPSAALIVGIGSVGGTYFLPYSKEFFAEPLSALGMVFGIERALANRPAAAGAGLAVAVLARAQTLLAFPVLLWVILRRCGVSGGVRASVPVGVGIFLTAAYNVARFGDPLESGYAHEGFTMPFLNGAHMLLLEPSKSLFLFAPVTVLVPWACVRLWRRDRPAFFLISWTLAMTFGVAALWHNPNGGWCWGPRLLLPGVAPAVAALGPWLDNRFNRALAIGLLILGFAVSAPAVAVSTQIQQLDVPPPAGGIWPPDLGLPRIGRQAELVPMTAAYTRTYLFERKDDGRNYLRYLTFWQIGLARVLGRPGLVIAMAASLVLVLVAMWAAGRCRLAYVELQRKVPGRLHERDETSPPAPDFSGRLPNVRRQR